MVDHSTCLLPKTLLVDLQGRPCQDVLRMLLRYNCGDDFYQWLPERMVVSGLPLQGSERTDLHEPHRQMDISFLPSGTAAAVADLVHHGNSRGRGRHPHR